MQKYCTSLEVSKRLVEKGWKKETKFYHCSGLAPDKVKRINGDNLNGDNFCLICSMSQRPPPNCKRAIPAPLSAEILEDIETLDILVYIAEMRLTPLQQIDLFKSVNALADCWIWAKGEGLVK
jgi:hypothetical protein